MARWTRVEKLGRDWHHLEQSEAKSCAPSCVAMLVWNWGVGFGFDPLAKRAGKWAIYDTWGKQRFGAHGWWNHYAHDGMRVDEIPSLLLSFGLRCTRRLNHILPTQVAAEEAANILNGLPRNAAAALVAGDDHVVLLISAQSGFVVMDSRIGASQGGVEAVGAGATIAEVLPNQQNPNEFAALLTDGGTIGAIRHIYVVPRQNVFRVQMQSMRYGLGKMHQYVTWFFD